MSYDVVIEDVPHWRRRVGDRVIEGSNNTLVSLETDRVDALDTGYGHINGPDGGASAGAVRIVAGRSSPDPNFSDDKAYMYLSMRTDVDDNLSLGSHGPLSNDIPAAVMKSDATRVVGRNNVVIASGDGSTFVALDRGPSGQVVLNATDIRLGSGASHPLVRGDSFMQTFNSFVRAFNAFVTIFNAHIHPPGTPGPFPTSPTPTPARPAQPMLRTDLSDICSTV